MKLSMLIFASYLHLMFHRSAAEEAIQKLNGTVIGTQTVRLSWGRNPPNKQVYTKKAFFPYILSSSCQHLFCGDSLFYVKSSHMFCTLSTFRRKATMLPRKILLVFCWVCCCSTFCMLVKNPLNSISRISTFLKSKF